LKEYDSGVHRQAMQFKEQEQALLAGNLGQEANILAAGQAARAKYFEDNKGYIVTLADLNQASLKAEQEYIKQLGQDRAAQSAANAIANQLASLQRGVAVKDTSDLDKVLEAVKSKYTSINNLLTQFNEKHPTAAALLPGGSSAAVTKAIQDTQAADIQQAYGSSEVRSGQHAFEDP